MINNSILEITADNYYIKLNKSNASLALLRKLVSFIEVENFEQQETDIITRNHDHYEGNFDRLDEK